MSLDTGPKPRTSPWELAVAPSPDQWADWTELDAAAWPERVEKHYALIPTICFNCESACGLVAYVDKATSSITKFEGNPVHPGSRGRTCAKGPATINLKPLKRQGKRGSGEFVEVSWEEALTDIGGRIRKAILEKRNEEVMYHVGRPGEELLPSVAAGDAAGRGDCRGSDVHSADRSAARGLSSRGQRGGCSLRARRRRSPSPPNRPILSLSFPTPPFLRGFSAIQSRLFIRALCWLSALVLVSCGTHSSDSASKFQPTWRTIFDGSSKEGWEMSGPGELVLQNGELETRGGMGLLYYAKEKLGDCQIRVVFEPTQKDDNSGVFIRIAERPTDPWIGVNGGYEIQIENNGDSHHRTGCLYSLTEAKNPVDAKVGEWNTFLITLDGPRTVVELNGTLITDYTEGQPVPAKTVWYEPERGVRPNEGYFGLQNHGDPARVRFKEVSVRPLW